MVIAAEDSPRNREIAVGHCSLGAVPQERSGRERTMLTQLHDHAANSYVTRPFYRQKPESLPKIHGGLAGFRRRP